MFDRLAILVCFGYAASFSLINWARFRQFQSFYYDFGIFAKAIWQLSRFKSPIIDHYTFGFINEFCDHFNPGIALLAPLFWLTRNPTVLLVTQCAAVGLTGWVLYLTAKTITKNSRFSLGILIAFFSYLGLQNAIIADFHPEVIALLPLSLALYFLTKNQARRFFAWLFLAFIFKESIAVFGLFIGIFLLLRRQMKLGISVLLVSVAWLLVVTKLIIPSLSPTKSYFYQPHYPRQPVKLISNVIDEVEERRTILISLGSFLFLPILAPTAWVLALGDFVVRFGPEASVFGNKTLTMHYSALAALGLAFAAIQAYPILKRFWPKLIPLVCIALIFIPPLLIIRPILNGPINLIYNLDFFRSIKNHRANEEFLAQIPNVGTIMTHNSLTNRFIDRELFLLRPAYHCYQPHYIVINAESGQNPNNFWELNYEDITQIIQCLKTDPNYALAHQQNEKYLFSRKTKRSSDFSRQAISNCVAEFESFSTKESQSDQSN